MSRGGLYSLDAQRDACLAYITSQKSKGWVALRDGYDDGGFTGGNLNRPGLQRLLEDIREGLVDVIVVHKIDRLSRSLADFAKLVELFDEHKVTKSWTTSKEKYRAGKLIDKGYLYKLFKNPVFIGVAAYKGKHFAGEHEPILDRAVWEQVQELLGRNEPEQRARQNRPGRAPALLKGLIFADDGWAMTPGATYKGDKFYCYYINTASMKIGKTACSVSRVPTGEIEAAVIAQVR